MLDTITNMYICTNTMLLNSLQCIHSQRTWRLLGLCLSGSIWAVRFSGWSDCETIRKSQNTREMGEHVCIFVNFLGQFKGWDTTRQNLQTFHRGFRKDHLLKPNLSIACKFRCVFRFICPVYTLNWIEVSTIWAKYEKRKRNWLGCLRTT